MNDDIKNLSEKIDALTIKVSEIYSALFGVEGQGGLSRCVRDHDNQMKELVAMKFKVIGAVAATSLIAGAVGAKLSILFK